MPRILQSLTNNHDDQLKKEKRFLLKHKLLEGKDYVLIISEVDNEIIGIGYYITRLTLYKLVSNRYGSYFMDAIILRVCQILYYYEDYTRVNTERCISQLQKQ